MAKIYKFQEYLVENLSSDTEKVKFIESICRECLYDFCFINGLEYNISFGRYYLHVGNFLHNSLVKYAMSEYPELLHLSFEKCFQINIHKTHDSVVGDEIGRKGSIQIGIDENTNDFKNCITHLKKSLERELDIIEFHMDDIKKTHWGSMIQVRYE